MSSIKMLAILSAIFMFGFNAQARDADESMFMLKEALMESNGDYNKHKKKSNFEEFDRADDWSSRDTAAIDINNRIVHSEDLKQFQEISDDHQETDQEVSSHNATKEEEVILQAD